MGKVHPDRTTVRFKTCCCAGVRLRPQLLEKTMHLHRIKLTGFRNFKSAEIHLAEKSLLIGANEAGKTNLLRAIGLLLSRDIPESALDPEDFDFFAHTPTHALEILLELRSVTEDCLLAKLKGHVSDGGELFLRYAASRDPETKKAAYELAVGPSEDSLTVVEARFWLRVLNLRYIASRRDLAAYIRKERRRLLQEARDKRTKEELDADRDTLKEIATGLEKVTDSVAKLKYIAEATKEVNDELKVLSYRHEGHDVRFDAAAIPIDDFVDNLDLASRTGEARLAFGGDGRNQQIHMALWAAANRVEDDDSDPSEVSLYAIEEPEAHLHPHQQRRLAEYLAGNIHGQVILSTHSPRIAAAFDPRRIARLAVRDSHATEIFGGPEDAPLHGALVEFGYRLQLVDMESFFADGVFLVEGPSELIFYRAAAAAAGLDLDRFNISIVSVDGIGFAPYADLLTRLGIKVAMRTDNDIMKIPYKDQYRMAGYQRAFAVARLLDPDRDLPKEGVADELTGFPHREPSAAALGAAKLLRPWLNEALIHLSDIDLEHDVVQALPEETAAFFGDEPAEAMRKAKATTMFAFVRENTDALSKTSGTPLLAPLADLISHLGAENANAD